MDIKQVTKRLDRLYSGTFREMTEMSTIHKEVEEMGAEAVCFAFSVAKHGDGQFQASLYKYVKDDQIIYGTEFVDLEILDPEVTIGDAETVWDQFLAHIGRVIGN